jgi:hypothetical protein
MLSNSGEEMTATDFEYRQTLLQPPVLRLAMSFLPFDKFLCDFYNSHMHYLASAKYDCGLGGNPCAESGSLY